MFWHIYKFCSKSYKEEPHQLSSSANIVQMSQKPPNNLYYSEYYFTAVFSAHFST